MVEEKDNCFLIEVLLLKQIKARHWEVLVRPGKRLDLVRVLF